MDRIQRDSLCMDSANDACFAFLFLQWKDIAIISWMLRIQPRDCIEMFERAFFNQLSLAADLNEPPHVFGVKDQQGYFGIGAHVLLFPKATHGVDADMRPVKIAPTKVVCGEPSGISVVNVAIRGP